MVDFRKKILNSDKFRTPALTFLRTGVYCSYPTNSVDYFNYWDEETRRCLDGYTASDGDYISGYNYFYLNYCPIDRITYKMVKNRHGIEERKRVQDITFPDFYDYDYYFFQAVQEAEELGRHLVVLKSRRKGYSYKCGAMLCRNFYLIEGSKSYAYASEKEFLVKDGILTKAWNYLDFIDNNTAWAKKRQAVNTTMHKRASMLVTDEYGNKSEVGYKSEILGVTIKNDPDKVRGKKAKLILFEEAGKCKELGAAWQIARPSVEQDGIAFGTMIAFGTGGSEGSDFSTLREMFYNPAGSNAMEFPNIWDDASDGTNCGFFIPQYTNLDVRTPDGTRLYMDEDGNTKHKEALNYVMSLREPVIKGATDSKTVDRYIAENCLTPAEACLELTGNIFPKKDLIQQLALIRTNKKLQNHKQVGDLQWVDGLPKWVARKSGDITKYPLGKDDNPTGSIVIWEHPAKDAPFGLYIAGCLTPGEKVMTDIGLMDVEDVTLSRKLINKDGNLVPINTLLRYEKVEETIYEVKTSNTYRTTTFTGEHPIYISKPILNSDNTINESKLNFDFVRMRNVEVNDWIKVPNIYKKEISVKEKEFSTDPDFYRFLGMWLGDGWCDHAGYKIMMAFNIVELGQRMEYERLVKKLFNRKVSSRRRDNCIECAFGMQELHTYLTGNFGKGAGGKYIPEWTKYLAEDKKLSLMLGYLDTDGCITKHTKGYYSMEYVSINLELLEAIQDIAFSLGLISNLSKLRSAKQQYIKNRIVNSKECYHLRFGNYDTISFAQRFNKIDRTKLEKVDLTKVVSYKRNRQGCFFDSNQDYIYFQIKDIKKDTYTGTVYNFDCETHTFMCHHITTHNCDPYDHDKSGTNSLGSTFIYKRFQNFEEYYDIIVAEYTGRPSTAEEYYENVRKLLVYYNARLLYENERKGLFPYFTSKHCDYLLADQPDIISDVVGNSSVQRRKGVHMVQSIKDWGEGLIKEWLNEEYAPGRKNLTKIFSEPLLEELIQYNDKKNADRVMALMMVMIYKEQLHNLHVKKKEKIEKNNRLFDIPLFSKQWFEGSTPKELDSTPTYTF